MSGIVGHSLYAVLGLKAAVKRRLPLARVAGQQFASYVAGAYLGSDIQTMPEAVCVDTGRDVGYGTVPIAKSPITGGEVRPFVLQTPLGEMRPKEVHDRFYGRAHLVFGWTVREKSLLVPWDHLPDYFAAVCEDVVALFGPGERSLAYVLGWIVHVVSDSMIKGVQPGVDLKLVDGRYTPRNRPVQDLVSFHEIGIREFHLNWPALFADLAATPVEPVQLHYMRCTRAAGALGGMFSDGWKPESEETLRIVLAENRRWVRHHAEEVLQSLQLMDGECSAEMQDLSGLRYAEMIAAAEAAHFRHALWQMGEAIAEMFVATQQRSKVLNGLARDVGPGWEDISHRWQMR